MFLLYTFKQDWCENTLFIGKVLIQEIVLLLSYSVIYSDHKYNKQTCCVSYKKKSA